METKLEQKIKSFKQKRLKRRREAIEKLQEMCIRTSLTKLKRTREAIEKLKNAGAFKDFCTKYKFDLSGDRDDFNLRCNQPGMRELMEIDFTGNLQKDIVKVIKIQSNIIIFIWGPRNMGKSEVAQTIWFYWKGQWHLLRKTETDVRLAFSTSQLNIMLKDIQEGYFGIRDESPPEAGEGSNTARDALQNIINITRGYQTSFAFLNPVLIEIPGVDYFLEVAGKDLKNKVIRCLWYDRRMRLIGPVYFRLHEDEEFRKEYKRQKQINIISTLRRGGIQESKFDYEQFDQDIKNLLQYCYDNNITNKNLIPGALHHYNRQFDPNKPEEAKLMIIGIRSYTDQVINDVYGKYIKKGNYDILWEEEDDEEEPEEHPVEQVLQRLNEFTFNYNESEAKIKELILKNAKWYKKYRERNLHIYEMAKAQGFENYTLISEQFKLDESTIAGIVSQARGYFNKFGGYLLEIELYKFLSKFLNDDRYKIIRDGSKSQPDIIIEDLQDNDLWVISVKLIKKEGDTVHLAQEEIEPERNFAQNNFFSHRKTYLILAAWDYINEKMLILEQAIKKPSPTYIKI